jgi:cytochrome c oxidase subunit 1
MEHTHDHAADHHDDHDHKPHKDIGTLYLVFALLMFFVGGSMALVIRAELFMPGLQLVEPDFFNQMTTMHALIMVFGAVMPAWVGFANWMIPMMIGAPDMALPRLNNWSFWILPFAFTMLLSTLLMDSGGPAAGWTLYPPLSLQGGQSLAFVIFAVHMMGISSIMGSINVIATILNMRAPDLADHGLPADRGHARAGRRRHDVVDRPFLRHQLLQRRRRRGPGDVPAYFLVFRASRGVHHDSAGLRRGVGDHSHLRPQAAVRLHGHGVRNGQHRLPVLHRVGPPHVHRGHAFDGSVPTGVKVFNWVSTMWRGSMTFETPMLFAIGFVVLFTIGGLSGLMLAITAADFQYHDTYFVVAHFHYVLVPGSVFALMAGAYYWLPKWTGHMYSEKWGKFHFWVSAISVNILFFPQHYLGLAGMPRRIPDYSTQFADFNMLSSVGGFIFGVSQLIFVGVIIHCVYKSRQAASGRVWEGARGLEWTLPSPPPYHSFNEPPVIDATTVAHAEEAH